MQAQAAPAVGTEFVVECHGLTKRYGSLVAVNDVSLSVRTGEVFGLLGPNGAGKTTTLEMLEGMRTPDAGSATVMGRSVTTDARRIKQRIGVQLQASALPPKTTVREALHLFRSFYHSGRSPEDLISEFDLEQRADVYSEKLSGGQLQRLSIALALVNDPDLVFLDEPTTGLDPQARLNLWDVIEGIRKQGKTVVLTTHYMEEAERLCDRVAMINGGKIVALDTPARLVARYGPGTTIHFETSNPNEALRQLAGVEAVDIDGSSIVLRTANPQTAMASLFAPGMPWVDAVASMRGLRLETGTLEDVFIALAGRSLDS
jgi:ABC-2 type transport system ATP-binding protein